MDPYAILICRSHEQKSSTVSGGGSEPEWNETFVFTISDHVSELIIKLMDSDTLSNDDFVGEAKIPLEPVFAEGSLPPAVYSVVKEQEYCGEIKVGLTFTPTQLLGKELASNKGSERECERGILTPNTDDVERKFAKRLRSLSAIFGRIYSSAEE
ncbi:elicitor-responsive protein 3 [Canna indica]|uniref:Elicitor-responsive protein 3 n=1 Tax=Canna indica TaxID=4628 RepID=A0AAQ3QRP7_9LILI|nr:elicitor-responsive protein 3 [Canna indica]